MKTLTCSILLLGFGFTGFKSCSTTRKETKKGNTSMIEVPAYIALGGPYILVKKSA